MGVFGSLHFGTDTLGDVLRNYSALGGATARVIEGFFAFSVCMTFPLVVFPARESMEIVIGKSERLTAFFGAWTACCCRCLRGGRRDAKAGLSILLTLFFVACAFLTAVLIPAIEVVFSVNGCVMGLALSFFLPAALFLKASRMHPKRAAAVAEARDRRWACAVLAISAPLGLAAVVMTFVSLAGGLEEEGGAEQAANATALCGL